MSLISKLFEDRKQMRAAAWRRYAELLAKNDPKDAPEVKALMETLGRTPEDAQQDAVAIERVLQAQNQVKAGTGLDAVTAKARDACKAHAEETRRIADARAEEFRRLYVEQQRLQNLFGDGQRAVHELDRLKKEHAELLAHVPAARVENLG